MKKLAASIIVLALINTSLGLYAQSKPQILYNRSKPTLSINLESPTQIPQANAIKSVSGLWRFEPVQNLPDYFRIINNQTDQNLNFENSKIEMSAVKEGENGAIWTKDAVKGTTVFFHIINRKTGQRLHLLNGNLQVSDVKGTSLTAMWKMVTATGVPAGPNPITNTNNKKAVNDYVNGLTYDPRKLLAVEGDGGTVLQDKQLSTNSERKNDNNKITVCTVAKYSMSNNFDEVVIMQPTNGIVYPGSLIYADQFLVRGQPRPLTSLSLAPVRLTVDLPGIGEKGNMTVKNPNNGNVQAELQKALQYWNENSSYKEGYVNAARSSSSAAVSFNSEQIGLSLGVNVKWASGEAGAQFSYNSTSSKSVALMMFKQVFYTVTAEPPANPSDAFGNITAAQVTATFGNDNPPAYVQSVSYGRIIMFRMETSEKQTEADMKASLKYAAGAVDLDVNAAAKYQAILRNSSITYALLGGNAEVLSETASAQNFKDLEPLIKGKNSVYSKSNPGVPIAYTVRFLKDHQIAKMGFTTEYTKETCESKNNIFFRLNHSGGYVAKYEITYNENGVDTKIETGNKTAGYSETFYFPGDATNIKLKGWAMTGLAWDPWGEIYNKSMEPADWYKCYKNVGTTLNRGWNNDCDGQPAAPNK